MNPLSSYHNQSWLSWFLRGLLILFFLILMSKMFEIQIIKGEYYRRLSEENRVRHIALPAPRGHILARGGEELPPTPDFAHLTGYLGKVNEQEVGKINPDCPEKGPRLSDAVIGRTGLQEQYECQLWGVDGEELIEVNTRGDKLRSLGRREAVSGQNIQTTVDYNLQLETARNMASLPEDGIVKKGAAIVTDTKGKVLAFYSSPSFDPQNIADSLNNQDLPLFNRVTSGKFHPGSVFKPVVAIAALEEGKIDKSFLYDDKGVINVKNNFSDTVYSYSNWYFSEFGKTEGEINLTRALARSTDTFFYKIGEMVGPDKIANWSQKFGLDKKTGIDLPGEKAGLIPTPEWKKKTIGEAWFLGNTYHMAIGQGDVSVTPIAINTYIAAIANRGVFCTPHLNSNIASLPKCEQLNIKQENIDLVKEGMKEACSDGGTAFTFFDFAAKHGGINVACKTGTAEVGTTDGTPHAWFTLMAPMDNPEIVATILIEKGGQGSQVAGPIARHIVDYYFQALETR